MNSNPEFQKEIDVLRDLADDSGRDYYPSTVPQLGRISEVFRRVMQVKMPRLVRVRAIAVLYGYDPRLFLTTEQLTCQGAGAFITWAFVPHKPDADLDAVPLREKAAEVIRWAIEEASDHLSVAELAADEEKCRERQRQRNRERYARNKREATSLSHQDQPVTA